MAALLCSIALGGRSFWLDESVSVTIAKLGRHDFAHVVRTREANMALYHLLLSWWIRIGDSEAAARSLSVIAAVATVPVVYLLARRLAGTRVALVAGLLLALNPMLVHYGQEARGYALCLLLVSSAAYLFVRGIEEPTWRLWIAFALVAVLAAYAHFFALLVPAALAVSLLFFPAASLPWRKLTVSAMVLVAGLVPLALLVAGNNSSGIEWASGNLPGRMAVRIHNRPALTAALLVAALAVVALGWRLLSRRLGSRLRSLETWRVAVVLCWLLVPFALVSVMAVVYRPLFVVRYFIVCLPPLVLVLALVVGRIRRSSLAVAVGLLLAVGSLGMVVRWYEGGQVENWRGATAFVSGAALPGDGVLFYAPYVRIPFSLYLDDSGPGRTTLRPVYPADGWSTNAIRFDSEVPVTRTLVRDRAVVFRRIWLVTSHVELYGRADPGYDATLAGLRAASFRKSEDHPFTGVGVALYTLG